jgi:hypothetical protein
MPSQAVCQTMNDPCDAETFDETIAAIATGGGDRFALIVNQSASHATKPETPPATTFSQWVLYIYGHGLHGWLYCEQEIGETEAHDRSRTSLRSWQFGDTEGRCTPSILVEPDMKTAAMNPFPNQAK